MKKLIKNIIPFIVGFLVAGIVFILIAGSFLSMIIYAMLDQNDFVTGLAILVICMVFGGVAFAITKALTSD